jgi:hypothetical protein
LGWIKELLGFSIQTPFWKQDTDRSEVRTSVASWTKSKVRYMDDNSSIKETTTGSFELEQEIKFPIDVGQHRYIINAIEEHLSCIERFNFRCAFSSVSNDSLEPSLCFCITAVLSDGIQTSFMFAHFYSLCDTVILFLVCTSIFNWKTSFRNIYASTQK